MTPIWTLCGPEVLKKSQKEPQNKVHNLGAIPPGYEKFTRSHEPPSRVAFLRTLHVQGQTLDPQSQTLHGTSKLRPLNSPLHAFEPNTQSLNAQCPPAPTNYPLRDPKYHLIETIRLLIEIHWGVSANPDLHQVTAPNPTVANRKP